MKKPPEKAVFSDLKDFQYLTAIPVLSSAAGGCCSRDTVGSIRARIDFRFRATLIRMTRARFGSLVIARGELP